jgi:hypothetical protein
MVSVTKEANMKEEANMKAINWNDVPDDLITLAKDVADGRLSMDIVAQSYKETFSEFIPYLKPIKEVYIHSVVSMRANYLRSLLK